MGRNNRQRRDAKKAARSRPGGGGRVSPSARSTPTGGGRRPAPADPSDPDDPYQRAAQRAVAEAAADRMWVLSHTVEPVSPARLVAEVTDLVAPLGHDARDGVQNLVEQWVTLEVDRSLDRHWEVGDLDHLVSRRLGADRQLLMAWFLQRVISTRLVERPSSAPSRWSADVAALLGELGSGPVPATAGVLEHTRRTSSLERAVAWADALALLQLLFRLPELPPIGPAHDWRSPADFLDAAEASAGLVDRKLLDRVRGLLTKAESTTFPEEADALTAKAQELMARHAIDQAMVEEGHHQAGSPGGEPSSRRLWIDNPYADGKSLLLHQVASANRCRAVFHPSLGFMTVIGYPADLDAVDLLFTSLLVQADTGIREAGSQVDRTGRSRTRSFRASFWVAFATRIGDRLTEAVAATVHDAEADHGSALLPVLASRSERVEAHLEELYPDVSHRGVVASNRAGWVAGTQAADRADIGVRRPIPSRST